MIQTELIRPVSEILASQAQERSDKAAFRDSHRMVSYEDLFARTGNLAGHLREMGLARGDRAAILMENSVETIESYLAIVRASGVAVSINPQATDDEVSYMLSNS